jgi:hypothetical protein
MVAKVCQHLVDQKQKNQPIMKVWVLLTWTCVFQARRGIEAELERSCGSDLSQQILVSDPGPFITRGREEPIKKGQSATVVQLLDVVQLCSTIAGSCFW